VTTLSDARLGGLRRALVVDSGQQNDLEARWLVSQIEAATGEAYTGAQHIGDLWLAYLGTQGVEPGSLPDMKSAHFEAVTGLDAARPDLELAFWQTL